MRIFSTQRRSILQSLKCVTFWGLLITRSWNRLHTHMNTTEIYDNKFRWLIIEMGSIARKTRPLNYTVYYSCVSYYPVVQKLFRLYWRSILIRPLRRRKDEIMFDYNMTRLTQIVFPMSYFSDRRDVRGQYTCTCELRRARSYSIPIYVYLTAQSNVYTRLITPLPLGVDGFEGIARDRSRSENFAPSRIHSLANFRVRYIYMPRRIIDTLSTKLLVNFRLRMYHVIETSIFGEKDTYRIRNALRLSAFEVPPIDTHTDTAM